ncbi:hypothetical protein ACPCZP_25175 [Bacillus bombysepticus]
MTKTATTAIQISIHDWNVMEVIVCGTRIGSVSDFFFNLSFR